VRCRWREGSISQCRTHLAWCRVPALHRVVARVVAITTPRVSADPRQLAATAARMAPPNSTPQQKQDWFKMLQGLSTYIPLLFGKAGGDIFGNEGLWGLAKAGYNKIFGIDPPGQAKQHFDRLAMDPRTIVGPEGTGIDYGGSLYDSPEMLDRLLAAQDANNSWDILPSDPYYTPPVVPGDEFGYVPDMSEYWGGGGLDTSSYFSGGDIPWWEMGGGDYTGFDPSWFEWGFDPSTFVGPI
jgi:hypothetical protein